MRDAVARRHVRRTDFGWQLTSDQRLVGRIEWDPQSNGRVPLVVIDGKAFSWEEVGRMLMTFEGFTLEARVRTPSSLSATPRQCEMALVVLALASFQ